MRKTERNENKRKAEEGGAGKKRGKGKEREMVQHDGRRRGRKR